MAAQPQSWIAENQNLVIRRATPADAEVCGRICFEAFGALAEKHNFPPDFPAPEIPEHVLSTMFSHPSFFCVVAEQNGKIIGSNCLDERTPIAGVGPITIDPGTQNRSCGTSTDASRDGTCGREEVRRSPSGAGGIPQSVTLTLCEARFRCARTTCVYAGDTNSEDAAGLSRPPSANRATSRPATTSVCESTGTTVGANSMTRFSKGQPWSPNRRGGLKPTLRPSPSSVMRLARVIRTCKH